MDTEVKLLMDYLDGKPIYEAVPAAKIGDNRYKILSSPGFAPGVGTGDEIELSSADKRGYRVLKRSGNICMQVFLYPSSEMERSHLASIIFSIGGKLEGGKDNHAGHLMIFSIHVRVGFDVIEKTMEIVAKKFKIDKWMYGNVYDTQDGATPLNWWNNEGYSDQGK